MLGGCNLNTGLRGVFLLAALVGCEPYIKVEHELNNVVLSIGANQFGMLGIGTEDDRDSSVLIPSLGKIVRLEASANNSMALTYTGELFVWGDNRYGQIGEASGVAQSLPIKVLKSRIVVAMSSGKSISAAVTSDGVLWMWGTQSIGVPGGYTFKEKKPVPIGELPKMRDVSCGANHCLALSENGEVWSWGNNVEGALGTGFLNNSTNFRKVENIPTIIQVAAGDKHSLALSSNGEVYVWGSNEEGQLGIGNFPDSLSIPKKLHELTDVISIKAGGRHSLCLRSNGLIMAWGRGRSGQLGNGGDNLDDPRRVSGINYASMIYASGEGSCAVTSSGAFYSWGSYNMHMTNFGFSYYSGIAKLWPTRIECLDGASVIARGEAHYLVARRKGKINKSSCF